MRNMLLAAWLHIIDICIRQWDGAPPNSLSRCRLLIFVVDHSYIGQLHEYVHNEHQKEEFLKIEFFFLLYITEHFPLQLQPLEIFRTYLFQILQSLQYLVYTLPEFKAGFVFIEKTRVKQRLVFLVFCTLISEKHME